MILHHCHIWHVTISSDHVPGDCIYPDLHELLGDIPSIQLWKVFPVVTVCSLMTEHVSSVCVCVCEVHQRRERADNLGQSGSRRSLSGWVALRVEVIVNVLATTLYAPRRWPRMCKGQFELNRSLCYEWLCVWGRALGVFVCVCAHGVGGCSVVCVYVCTCMCVCLLMMCCSFFLHTYIGQRPDEARGVGGALQDRQDRNGSQSCQVQLRCH